MQYEPELFPGLIYRMKEPKVVLLIFVSGKVVLTGRSRLYCVFWTHISALAPHNLCLCNQFYVIVLALNFDVLL